MSRGLLEQRFTALFLDRSSIQMRGAQTRLKRQEPRNFSDHAVALSSLKKLVKSIAVLVLSLSGQHAYSQTTEATNANITAQQDCSCIWRGSFSEVAAKSDLVALGNVVRVRGNAVDLRLEESLLGDAYLDDIRVWMKARSYCRPSVETFPLDSRWVMALNRINEVPEDGFNPSTPNISYGRKGDYVLSSCGGYFLKASSDAVSGNLVPDATRWEYAPKMTPVLIDLLRGYLKGDVPIAALEKASKEDPAVRELMLNTRSFLRGQDMLLDSSSGATSEQTPNTRPDTSPSNPADRESETSE